MKKRTLLAFFTALLLLLSTCFAVTTTALAEQATDDPSTVIVAKVGEVEITLEEYNSMREYLAATYGFDSSDSAYASLLDSLKDGIIETLIMKEVQVQKAHELGYYEFTEEEIETIEQDVDDNLAMLDSYYREEIEAENPDLTEEEIDQQVSDAIDEYLASQNTDREGMLQSAKDYLAYSKMYDDCLKDVTVSEEEIKAKYDELVESDKTTYEENPSYFESAALNESTTIYYSPEGARRVKHILIKIPDETLSEIQTLEKSDNEEDLQKAEELYDEAMAEIKPAAQAVLDSLEKDGSNFDEVMNEKSEDTGLSSAPDGYVVVPENSSYVAEFVEEAMSLEKVGDISTELVPTSYGYHILRLEEILPSGATSYEEVKDTVAQVALEEKQIDEYTKICEEWKETLNVETYPEVVPNLADDSSEDGASSASDSDENANSEGAVSNVLTIVLIVIIGILAIGVVIVIIILVRNRKQAQSDANDKAPESDGKDLGELTDDTVADSEDTPSTETEPEVSLEDAEENSIETDEDETASLSESPEQEDNEEN